MKHGLIPLHLSYNTAYSRYTPTYLFSALNSQPSEELKLSEPEKLKHMFII